MTPTRPQPPSPSQGREEGRDEEASEEARRREQGREGATGKKKESPLDNEPIHLASPLDQYVQHAGRRRVPVPSDGNLTIVRSL